MYKYRSPVKPQAFLDTALELHEWGLAVLPCMERGKEPHRGVLPLTAWNKPTWKQFQIERADLNTVELWGKTAPLANPAIICGQPSLIAGGYLFAVDCDDYGLFQELRPEVEQRWGPTLTVRSYRGGHFYFRSHAPVKTRNIKFQNRKLEIKGQSSYLLTYGALHPEGVFYELLSAPNNIAFVEDFSPIHSLEYYPPADFSTAQWEKAHRIANEKARNKRRHDYESLSELDMAIITACYNAGIPRPIIQKVLRDVKTGGGTHYQRLVREEGAQVAERNFEFSYQKASELGDSSQLKKLHQNIAHLQAWVAQAPWAAKAAQGISGVLSFNDRDVLNAHIQRCLEAKRESYGLDCRTGAELAGLSRETFSKSTSRLRQRGIIELAKPSNGEHALSNVYRLCIDFIPNRTLPHDSETKWELAPLPQRGSVSSGIKSGDCPSTHAMILNLTHPNELEKKTNGVFSRKGLGKIALHVYRVLLSQGKPEGLRQKEICNITGISQSAVSKVLHSLITNELANKQGHSYFAVESPDYVAISEKLGTTEVTEGRRFQHEFEREKHQEELEEKRSKST